MDKYTKIISDMMDIALSKITPHKWEVYRGISRYGNTWKLIEKMSPWDTFTDKWFLSSSKSLSEAENFSLKWGIIMQIKSKSWKDISKMSYAPEEMEVLFPRNTTMKFLWKNWKGHFVFQEI